MGFTPQEVRRMSIWQYLAALEGYVLAHNPDADKALTESEKDDIWQWLQGKDEG